MHDDLVDQRNDDRERNQKIKISAVDLRLLAELLDDDERNHDEIVDQKGNDSSPNCLISFHRLILYHHRSGQPVADRPRLRV